MIILIGGEKGGTGKTTLATNIATMRILKGHDALLIDTDKQGSSSAWSIIRDDKGIKPRVPSVQKFGANLTNDVKDLQSRYEDIIIDAGGRDSIELRASMIAAEIMYIPVQASQFDIWTLSIMNDLVKQARALNPRLIARVIINRAATNPSISETQEAKDVHNDFEELTFSDCTLKERISFRKAAKSGICIEELEKKDAKAGLEINNLYKEIFNE